jgi:predicted 3-demethylubiquinone-9 3-methyltransferase (glyoxalase superfamily)
MTGKIYPCLWFDGNAKEAATFYCAVFKNAKITSESPMVVTFDLDGRKIMCLNGGPHFKFNEAVSFVIPCEDQAEIDYFWDTLTSNGGVESRCGWLKDKFGVSWQVIPGNMAQFMTSPERSVRVMEALLKMNKLDIEILQNA